MESLIPGNAAVVLVLFSVVVIVLRALVDVRSLFTVPARKEHITREEYEKDEKARKERHRAVVVKCRLNAKRQVAERNRVDSKFESLLEGLNGLKVQLARVATVLEQEPHRNVHVVSARQMAVPPVEIAEPPQGAV